MTKRLLTVDERGKHLPVCSSCLEVTNCSEYLAMMREAKENNTPFHQPIQLVCPRLIRARYENALLPQHLLYDSVFKERGGKGGKRWRIKKHD